MNSELDGNGEIKFDEFLSLWNGENKFDELSTSWNGENKFDEFWISRKWWK